MHRLHVYNQFHAVGHGTFFVGQLHNKASGMDRFTWVYDCGSQRPTRIEAAVNGMTSWPHWPEEIDLLIISHFDNDHVNGLEQLLSRTRVKTLVLPYLSFRQRLAVASSADRGEAVSPAVAMFALDPIGFLKLRGLSGAIDSVIFVQGGELGALDAGDGLPGQPDPEQRPQRQSVNGWSDNEYARLVTDDVGPSKMQISTRSHKHPIFLHAMCWEFVFFNQALPSGVATRSRMPIAFVQNEIKEILQRFRVLDSSRRPRRSWRDKLKQCYVKHFGSSGPERNNISLCVLSRPLSSSNANACRLFRLPLFSFEYVDEKLPISEDRQGLLLTGDLTLNFGVFEEMKLHFRPSRWKLIDVMQVPHHGSRHSWQIGLAAHCVHRHSVLCVPDHSKSKAHPHDDVVAALRGLAPIRANYQQSVIQTFHFDAS